MKKLVIAVLLVLGMVGATGAGSTAHPPTPLADEATSRPMGG